MALESTSNFTRPGQVGATGAIDALHIEEYTGVVEQTIARKSALEGFVSRRSVKGTSVITNYAVGESTLQKLTPGTTPDGNVNKFGKNSLHIDTVVLARSIFRCWRPSRPSTTPARKSAWSTARRSRSSPIKPSSSKH
jgi:hypothetical protein